MDPNETLKKLRAILETTVEDEKVRAEAFDDAQILFDGLDQWLRRGGFLPAEWNTPARKMMGEETILRIDMLPVNGNITVRNGVVYTSVRGQQTKIGEVVG